MNNIYNKHKVYKLDAEQYRNRQSVTETFFPILLDASHLLTDITRIELLVVSSIDLWSVPLTRQTPTPR